MRCAILLLTLVSLVLAAPGAPQDAPKRKIPCKTPENASMCYWTRGRLSVYNGNPPWRMWKVGTRRMLAIYSGPSKWPPRDIENTDSINPEFPENLKRAYQPPAITAFPNVVFADFEICPLEPERPGVMQHACIESAKNIFAQKWNESR